MNTYLIYYCEYLFLSKRMRPLSRTVASAPRPPDIRNGLSI